MMGHARAGDGIPIPGPSEFGCSSCSWDSGGRVACTTLSCISRKWSANNEVGREGMFARILIAGWALVFVVAFLLLFFPKVLVRVPHLELFRPLFISLWLVTVVSGLVSLYRQGMKRARRK